MSALYRSSVLSLALGFGLVSLFGCSSKSNSPSGPGGDAGSNTQDAATDSGGGSVVHHMPMMPMNHGGDASPGDASVSGDATVDASGPVSFMVPNAGGTVSIMGGSGQPIDFTFPASAAGLGITLTPVAASTIGWPATTFEDVIQMEPDGTTFADPVVVKSGSGTPIAFSFSSSATQSAPEALELSADGKGLLLHHFSTLAFVPPGQSCDGDSGWVVAQDNSACADAGANSKAFTFSCAGSSFCYQIDASCCAPADAVGCSLGYDAMQISFTRTGTQNGAYPYCAMEGGAADAGGDASSAAEPTLLTLEPTAGPVGASVTVTGQGFDTYFGTAANHYVVGFDFESQGTVVSAPAPTQATQDANLNIMHFVVPNLALGPYDVRMKFRDGTASANTLPFTITAQ
ncbi:MAG TPA: hypothetical protein VL137_15515 [Polyangiaceae bacterium]|nr:hypothetical protein [Polyangiaceae bacterium]